MGRSPSLMTRRGLLRFAVASGAAITLPRFSATAQNDVCLHMESFPVPAGTHPHDVAPAADGVGVWFTAQASGELGLLTPVTGETELIDLGDGSSPHGVIVGPDGAAWVTDSGRDEILRVDADSKEITRFPTGLTGSNLNTAAFDGKGRQWFTGQGGIIGRLDPDNGNLSTLNAPRGRGPYGICATPNGDVWFVSLAASFLGKLTYRQNEIVVTEYDPPTANAGTRRVWSDSSGRLWVAQWNAGQVGVYDPKSKKWNEWRLPGDSPKAYAVYVDEWDIVWLTDFGANAIVRFDAETETFEQLPLPHAAGSVRQLLGRHGEIWGAESGADHLVVVRTVCAGP